MTGPIRYARSGDVNIAYQVVGEGPFDLVLVHGFFSHLELDWEHPDMARFFERLASFSRLIRFALFTADSIFSRFRTIEASSMSRSTFAGVKRATLSTSKPANARR